MRLPFRHHDLMRMGRTRTSKSFDVRRLSLWADSAKSKQVHWLLRPPERWADPILLFHFAHPTRAFAALRACCRLITSVTGWKIGARVLHSMPRTRFASMQAVSSVAYPATPSYLDTDTTCARVLDTPSRRLRC